MSMLKKRTTKICFCLLLSIFFLSCINFSNYYYGHDGLFHINRLEGIVKAFEDGQILTKIYPYTNNGYGYAVSLFYCDLLLYPFAIIHKLGVPLIVSYIIMIVFYSSFSIFAMMWSSSKIFKNNDIAPYIATLLFSFCNYRLLDLYVRNALGETLAMCFAPFVFYALYSIFIEKEDKWICLGLSYAGIAISHNITLLIYGIYFLIIYLCFVVLNRCKDDILKITKTSLKGALLAILLSSFYLIPLLEQTISQEFLCTKYYVDQYNLASTCLSLNEILATSFINNELHYSTNLGVVLSIVPILYIFQKKKNKYITCLIVLYFVSILCIAGYIPIIFNIRFFNIIQFVWRIYIFIFPLSVLLSTNVLINVNKKFFYCALLMVLVTSIYSQFRFHTYLDKHIKDNDKIAPINTSHEKLYDFSTLSDSYYYNFYEMFAAEYLPPTESYDYLKESTYIKKINGNDFDEILIGNDYLPYDRRGTNISFDYDSIGDELLMVPLTYYKGYKVYVFDENNKQEIKLVTNEKYKQVSFKTISGNHHYVIHYDGTNIQKITLLLSCSSVFFVFMYCFVIKKYIRNR